MAIINANHATTLAMHLAGMPVLQIPLFLEQELNAASTVRFGAGVSAAQNDLPAITAGLERLLQSDAFTAAAGRFAAKYSDFSAATEIAQATHRLDELLKP